MKDVNRLPHSVWECRYHIVWIPKCRQKNIYGEVSKYSGKRQNFTGQNFRTRGYYVSAAGRDEEMIRKYIREQEDKDKRLDQLEMFKNN
jgi:REP element-mobilizing transposase RayT